MSTLSTSRSTVMEDVTTFIVQEARLLDELRYEEWEQLWTDDALYWVPANGEDIDPDRQMSIIYDNRSRLGLRVRQLATGKRHSQMPRSSLRHLISNYEILEDNGDEVVVGANTIIFETSGRGDTLWGGRLQYKLRRDGSSFKMAYKKVTLVNNSEALYTMAFLI